ncbi:hypothetical protein B0H17DRAFT_1143203 [Mycena rosella]|uniref:Uncharacterized protein n=1 Tax=Mycena rosella TaxID=1033263 RepID=A0AAD7G8H8_MYCRO|nr:hypothetical protein B0H17DRAFT_1143203 [Mycena rosella]
MKSKNENPALHVRHDETRQTVFSSGLQGLYPGRQLQHWRDLRKAERSRKGYGTVIFGEVGNNRGFQPRAAFSFFYYQRGQSRFPRELRRIFNFYMGGASITQLEASKFGETSSSQYPALVNPPPPAVAASWILQSSERPLLDHMLHTLCTALLRHIAGTTCLPEIVGVCFP